MRASITYKKPLSRRSLPIISIKFVSPIYLEAEPSQLSLGRFPSWIDPAPDLISIYSESIGAYKSLSLNLDIILRYFSNLSSVSFESFLFWAIARTSLVTEGSAATSLNIKQSSISWDIMSGTRERQNYS